VTVSVGDKPNPNGVYDSKHTINVEGASAIKDFQGKQEYQLATVQVNVTDGKLSVDAISTNTKLNYLEIVNVTPGSHPRYRQLDCE